MISGKDLIEFGHKPAIWFKEAIETINKQELSGEAMHSYIESIKPAPINTIPLQSNIPFFENIKAENEVEQDNLNKVRASMLKIMETPTVVSGNIMPDCCPSGPIGTIPVGGVIISRNTIFPGMHSADICCSVMLTNLGKLNPKDALDAFHNITHFGPGGRQRGNQFKMSEELIDDFKSNSLLNSPKLISLAMEHLGTCGSSNHFNFVGTLKSTGDVCIVTHFGSRAPGANLYKAGMVIAEKFRKQLSPDTMPCNAWIPFDTKEGEEYWKALQIIRKWTKENHISLHDKVCKTLEINKKDRHWNEHNFVFKDNDLFYHAKGATPMDGKFLPDAENSKRIIPLNMAQPILIAEGTTTETNLGFAPHGAGRNMSRTQHKAAQGNRTKEEIFAEETKGIDARFYFGKIDLSELPSAYKDAEQVKAQIKEFKLANVVDELDPYGSIMSGEEQFNKT